MFQSAHYLRSNLLSQCLQTRFHYLPHGKFLLHIRNNQKYYIVLYGWFSFKNVVQSLLLVASPPTVPNKAPLWSCGYRFLTILLQPFPSHSLRPQTLFASPMDSISSIDRALYRPRIEMPIPFSGRLYISQGLSNLVRLEELVLDGNQLTTLDGLGKCTSLSELSLRSNRVADLAGLSSLTRLDILRVDANKIEGLESLPNLPELTVRVGS